MKNKEVAPTHGLKTSIFISSLIMFLSGISIFSYIFVEKLGAGSAVNIIFMVFCLVLPFSAVYLRRKKVSKILCYFILDAHFVFWMIIALLTTAHDIKSMQSTAIALCFYFGVLIFKRKSNFMVMRWQSARSC